MITFNLEQLNNALGSNYTCDEEVINFLDCMCDYFHHHNKNLTSQQYQFIQDFTSIIDAVEKY